MTISNRVYDILNICAKIIGPIVVFISAILSIWHVPYAEQITATFAGSRRLCLAPSFIFSRFPMTRRMNERSDDDS